MKRISVIFVAILFVLSIPFSYTYWDVLFDTHSNFGVTVHIAQYADEPSLDRLPVGTPDYILEILETIKAGDPPPTQDEMNMLVDGVLGILEALPNYDHQYGKVVIGKDVNGLFENGQAVDKDSLLIYVTSDENGSKEVAVVHVSKDSNFVINDAESLYYALERPWTGVNQISSMWLRGNLYDTYNAPLEYQDNIFLMNYNGPSGTPPVEDRGAWFRVPINYEFDNSNGLYYQNYIVKDGADYYISNQAVWSNQSPSTLAWAWNIVNLYSGGTVNENDVVYTQTDRVRFWRALSTTSNAPNEENARNGLYREINNGWIGRNGDSTIKSYYFPHNTYKQGDVVIFGISPKLKYRYYQARKDVNADTPPLKVSESGLIEINDEFWSSY